MQVSVRDLSVPMLSTEVTLNWEQKLYVSDTSVTGKGVAYLACFARDLHSLSLVGCQINLMELMVLGDSHYRCSHTLEDLHLSSAQYSAYYLQASMHIKSTPKAIVETIVVDDSDKENQPDPPQLNVVPDGMVHVDEGK